MKLAENCSIVIDQIYIPISALDVGKESPPGGFAEAYGYANCVELVRAPDGGPRKAALNADTLTLLAIGTPSNIPLRATIARSRATISNQPNH